jgi:hypothetical protein
MNYVQIDLQTGDVKKYPYGPDALRQDNQETSFPIDLSEQGLAEWGVFPVALSDMPVVSHAQTVKEASPKLNKGIWEQVWEVAEATPQEIEDRTRTQARRMRSLRNQRLQTEIDTVNPLRWETLSDIEKSALHAKRQALLDVPQQAGFPWTIDWPVAP